MKGGAGGEDAPAGDPHFPKHQATLTHTGVAAGTQDLLQERQEAGEDAHATPKAYSQDQVGLISEQLQGMGFSEGQAT